MPSIPDRIGQSPENLDLITPLKERACDALNTVLRRRQRPAGEPRVMRQGDERC